MLKKLRNFLTNEIIISILLIFLTLLNFINPVNIKQIGFTSLWPLILFTAAISTILISVIYVIKKFYQIKEENLYIIVSITYFLLFFYKDFKTLVDSFNPSNPEITQLINWRYYGEISILIITTIACLIFFLNKKFLFFKNFLRTFTIFFILANIFFNFYNHVKNFLFFNFNLDKNLTINDIAVTKIDETNNYKIKERRNVYYIIFDGMISLENAKNQNVNLRSYKLQNFKKELLKKDLIYIDESISNYNVTYLTLASIFYLNSPINEMSLRYKDNNLLFPKLLKSDNDNILNNILKKHKYKFYYFGNTWNECDNDLIANINCYKPISSSNHLQLLESFLRNTPIIPLINIIFRNFFGYDKNQNKAKFFLDNYETIVKEIDEKSNKNESNFIFVHAMSPHPPFLDERCKFNYNKSLTNYSFSYECVLNKILDFTNFLNKYDPTSLIVFQGDHGWNISIESSDNFDENIYSDNPIINEKLNPIIENEIFYRSSIFNAIKAPKKCLQNQTKPKNNSNTIKFILNCLFDYNLIYEPNNHYIGFYESEKNYGKVYKSR